jgi:hypothetical protein
MPQTELQYHKKAFLERVSEMLSEESEGVKYRLGVET